MNLGDEMDMGASRADVIGVGNPGLSFQESIPAAIRIWRTPGVAIAQRCGHLPEVILIAERYEESRHSVLVVLKSDPEEVLDAVYDAEADTIKELTTMPFDLRVMVPTDTWSREGVSQSYLVRYQADERRGG